MHATGHFSGPEFNAAREITTGQSLKAPDRAFRLYHGDCVASMRSMPDNSVDAIVSDPPYGLGFMGKSWDSMEKNIGKTSHQGQTSGDGPWGGVTYSASANVKCAKCGLWRWSSNACTCAQPEWPNTKAHEGRLQYLWHLQWVAEAYRILKPGGHMIAFGGTRTMHRLTAAVEDVGFEVRDVIHWCYWSGFPKGMNLSKQFDKQTVRDRETGELVFGGSLEEVYEVTRFIKAMRDREGYTNRMIDEHFGYTGMAGHWTSQKSQPQIPNWDTWLGLKSLLGIETDSMDALVWRLNGRKGQPGDAWHEREVVGEYEQIPPASGWRHNLEGDALPEPAKRTAPLTDNAKAWEGWNTALKPAIEPCVLARKPLGERTVAANLLRWGVGAINVDACRMSEMDDCWPGPKPNTKNGKLGPFNRGKNPAYSYLTDEFWDGQATVDEPVRASGQGSGTGAEIYGYRRAVRYGAHPEGWWPANLFQCAKPGKKEREAGLDDFEAKVRMPDLDMDKEWVGGHNAYLCGGAVERKNNHPTVKPIKLMRWLCRLVTPPGGVVLDPFMGSGSTGCAAMLEGFDFMGCELYPLPPGHEMFDPKNNVDAVGISKARIEHWRSVALDDQWTATYGSIDGLIGVSK